MRGAEPVGGFTLKGAEPVGCFALDGAMPVGWLLRKVNHVDNIEELTT